MDIRRAQQTLSAEGSTKAAPPWPPEGSGGVDAAIAIAGSGGVSQDD